MGDGTWKRWKELTTFYGDRHTLILGGPDKTDVILYSGRCNKEYKLLSTVSHKFSYELKKEDKEITAVVAYDRWGDGTGGYAELTKGDVGKKEVEIEVTSQLNRGFSFEFVVFGTKKPQSAPPQPSAPRPPQPSTQQPSDVKEIKHLLLKEPEKNDAFGILRKRSTDWKDFAIALNVDDDVSGGLKKKGDMMTDKEKLEEVLKHWIDSQCSDVTWRKLLDVLGELQLNKIAADLVAFLKKDDIKQKYKDKENFKKFNM